MGLTKCGGRHQDGMGNDRKQPSDASPGNPASSPTSHDHTALSGSLDSPGAGSSASGWLKMAPTLPPLRGGPLPPPQAREGISGSDALPPSLAGEGWGGGFTPPPAAFRPRA